ncbi:MAG TPA: hypothetical protein VKA01_03820 [Vicinamibacteria bacterium]|nr:hypothetical protein [Vicinamibacteria bacterium]
MRVRTRVVVAFCVLAVVACKEKEKEGPLLHIGQDRAVLQDVTAAVNEVIRNAADCDAAKAAMPEAERRLSEAYGKVKEPISQETLKVLAAQLKGVREACP